jgi:hypothetical protein
MLDNIENESQTMFKLPMYGAVIYTRTLLEFSVSVMRNVYTAHIRLKWRIFRKENV